jgi:hypothetical protein
MIDASQNHFPQEPSSQAVANQKAASFLLQETSSLQDGSQKDTSYLFNDPSYLQDKMPSSYLPQDLTYQQDPNKLRVQYQPYEDIPAQQQQQQQSADQAVHYHVHVANPGQLQDIEQQFTGSTQPQQVFFNQTPLLYSPIPAVHQNRPSMPLHKKLIPKVPVPMHAFLYM